MILTFAGLLTPALYVLALAVTSASGYLFYRQNLSTYRVLRDFLAGVYVLVSILIILELWRTVAGSAQSMEFYAAASISLGTIQALLLAAAAVGTYVQPMGSDYRSLLRDLGQRRTHAVLLSLFALLSLVAIVFVVLFKPYITEQAFTMVGGQVWAIRIPASYVFLLVILLFFFLCYPTLLLYRVARRIPNPTLGGSLLSLPIGWAAVIVIYLIFESLLWFFGIDAIAVLYLLNSVLFSLVTRRFSKAAVLAGLVVPAAAQHSVQRRATTVVGIRALEFSGRPILFLVDPSSPFESAVKDIASDLVSQGRSVFVFTSRGSRIGGALASMEGVKLYLFTTNVSYYQPGERPNEVLLAATNISVALDAIGKTLGTVTEHGLFILFDSLSDLILSSGFDETYRFLKTALEMASEKSVLSVFIILSGAHEHAVENIIRSQFSVEIVQDEGVLRVSKAPATEGPA